MSQPDDHPSQKNLVRSHNQSQSTIKGSDDQNPPNMELDLSNRRLSSIPAEVFGEYSSSIAKINIANNKFTTFESFECEFEHLTHLNAENNLIQNISELYRLSQHKKLESLMLQGNPITQVEDYRKLVLFFLSHLQALDNLPVLPEERDSLEAFSRRNFKLLPNLLQNMRQIKIHNQAKDLLKLVEPNELEHMQDPKMLVKLVMGKAERLIGEQVVLFEQHWTVQIIDDVCTLAENKKASAARGYVDHIYDRAVIDMVNRQLERLTLLREHLEAQATKQLAEKKPRQIDRMIEISQQLSDPRGYQAFAGSFSGDNYPYPVSDDARQVQRRMGANHNHEHQTNTDTEGDIFQTEGVVTSLDRSDTQQRSFKMVSANNLANTEGLGRKAGGGGLQGSGHSIATVPRGGGNSPVPVVTNRGGLTGSVQRGDDLFSTCKTKDGEITDSIRENSRKRDVLRRLEAKLLMLESRGREFEELSGVRDRMRDEVAKSEEGVREVEDLQRRIVLLEAEIKGLKIEVVELEAEVKKLIEDETNEELARDLRAYHLRVRVFNLFKGYLQEKKQLSVVAEFRNHQLRKSLWSAWVENLGRNKTYKLFSERVGVEFDPNLTHEEVGSQIAIAHEQRRSQVWKRFYFEILVDYTAQRIRTEKLYDIAEKYHSKSLKRKSVTGFKIEYGTYHMTPIQEAVRWENVLPDLTILHRNRIWQAWKKTFKYDLHPKFLKLKEFEYKTASKAASKLFEATREAKKTSTQTQEVIRGKHVSHLKRIYLTEWSKSVSDLMKKTKVIEKAINYKKKRMFWRAFKSTLKAEKVHAQKTELEKARSSYQEEQIRVVEAERDARERDLEQLWQSKIETFKKHRSQNYILQTLKKGTKVQKAMVSLEAICRRNKLAKLYAMLAEHKAESQRTAEIETHFPSLKQNCKTGRKRLLLHLWRESAVLHKQHRLKELNLKSQCDLGLLQHTLQRWKVALARNFVQQTKQLKKTSFLEESKDAQRHRDHLRIANENEDMIVENRKLTERLQQREQTVAEAKRVNKGLKEKRDAIALLLQEKTDELERRQRDHALKIRECTEEIEEKKALVQKLLANLKVAENEVRILDKKLENTNTSIREQNLESDLLEHEISRLRTHSDETSARFRLEISDIKASILQEQELCATLESIKKKREAEIVELHKLASLLKAKRQENLKVSEDRITRFEDEAKEAETDILLQQKFSRKLTAAKFSLSSNSLANIRETNDHPRALTSREPSTERQKHNPSSLETADAPVSIRQYTSREQFAPLSAYPREWTNPRTSLPVIKPGRSSNYSSRSPVLTRRSPLLKSFKP